MVLLISVFTACDNVSNNPTVVDKETTEVTETKPSIIGKWYYNSEDDRYYYQFLSNGKVYYRYYQNIGSPTSSLNSFVTVEGTWSYHDIIVLKPELDAYVKKWCEKDVPTKSTLD